MDKPSAPRAPAAAALSPLVFEPATRADPDTRQARLRPPIGRRWKPGESGNPAGRPRRKSLPSAPAALERALKGRVTVETGGRARRLLVAEALIERMIDQALAGDTAARRDLLKAQAELDAANAARREAARLAREEKARAAAEAAERARQAADTEPIFPCGWDQQQFMEALQSWNVCVRRGDKFYLRQWVSNYGLFAPPPAGEDDPWPFRPAIDPIGEARSVNEIKRLRQAIADGVITEAEAPRWHGGVLYGEKGEGGGDAPAAAGGAETLAETTLPPEPELLSAPAPVAEEDWVDRLCRGGAARGGDWRG